MVASLCTLLSVGEARGRVAAWRWWLRCGQGAVQAEGAQELREHGVLSNGATPLWMPNARSGLLPLLPEHVLHIDYVAETVKFTAPERWLRDHLAPRMVRLPLTPPLILPSPGYPAGSTTLMFPRAHGLERQQVNPRPVLTLDGVSLGGIELLATGPAPGCHF